MFRMLAADVNAKTIEYLLDVIFYAALPSGAISEDWLSARAVPVVKKDYPSLLSSYRPILLICITCKLIKYRTAHYLNTYFDCHMILTNKRHGYRQGFSTTQLATTAHVIIRILKCTSKVGVVFLVYF